MQLRQKTQPPSPPPQPTDNKKSSKKHEKLAEVSFFCSFLTPLSIPIFMATTHFYFYFRILYITAFYSFLFFAGLLNACGYCCYFWCCLFTKCVLFWLLFLYFCFNSFYIVFYLEMHNRFVQMIELESFIAFGRLWPNFFSCIFFDAFDFAKNIQLNSGLQMHDLSFV